ncbi:MAG: hypothetical protein IPP77_13435 [Bacteroidetes bacterium]|nr:hypothetical protein [Bacteroidota bacterium]
MKKVLLPVLAALFILIASPSFGQSNVGIGIASPDASALLHLNANDKGMLVPRMTTAQRTAIASPADGLLVYDTDIQCFFFNKAGVWTNLCAGASGGSNNTSMTYNTNTNVLSLTDAGGTLSTTIPPRGRWAVKGTTDINLTGTQTTGFAPMTGMTLTFTPSSDTVFIIASAAGDLSALSLLTRQTNSLVGMRVRDTGNSAVIGAGQSMANSTFAGSAGAAWNISFTSVYAVTPGVPVTLQMDWAVGWGDGQPGQIQSNISDGYSNRNIVVFE